MQQALYNHIAFRATKTNRTSTATPVRKSWAQRIAQKWDFYGVVTLMLSSGLYGLYALAHAL